MSASNILGGAASGAMAGSSLGPPGMIGGALLGGLFGGFGGGSDVDYMALANQQTQANRPDQTTPFASSNWTQGPNGEWSQQVGFNPQLQGAADSLMTQWGQNAASGYGNGQDAFNQAFGASWGAAQNALNPIYDQRENALRSRLLNSGAELGGEIGQTSMGAFGDQRAKDYQNALYGAVGQGFAAQGQMFNQNRQAWLDPLNALGNMQGLLQMPNVPAAGNYQQAGSQQMLQNQYNNQQQADLFGGMGDLASQYASPTPAAQPNGTMAPFSFGAMDYGTGAGNGYFGGTGQPMFR